MSMTYERVSFPLILRFHTKPPPLRFLGTNYRNSLLLLPSMQHSGTDFTSPPPHTRTHQHPPSSFLSPKSEARILFLAVSILVSVYLGHAIHRSYHGVRFYLGAASSFPFPVSLPQSPVARSQGISGIPGAPHFCSSPSGESTLLHFGGAKILEKSKTCKLQFKEAGSVCTPSWERLSPEEIGMALYGSAQLSLLTLPPASLLT